MDLLVDDNIVEILKHSAYNCELSGLVYSCHRIYKIWARLLPKFWKPRKINFYIGKNPSIPQQVIMLIRKGVTIMTIPGKYMLLHHKEMSDSNIKRILQFMYYLYRDFPITKELIFEMNKGHMSIGLEYGKHQRDHPISIEGYDEFEKLSNLLKEINPNDNYTEIRTALDIEFLRIR